MYRLALITSEGKPWKELSELVKNDAAYIAIFVNDLKGSGFLNRVERQISISEEKNLFQGNWLPSPVNKLYIAETFVSNEEEFLKKKKQRLKIGVINSFNGFPLELPSDLNLEGYNSVLFVVNLFRNFLPPLSTETNLTFSS
ncbi:hypothetical protein N9V13_05635 [Betaproteobacteria bacterium]|nr:hypothetical protein [Betaproteobacteria bacterium]